jgi:signal transduction histidine kinase
MNTPERSQQTVLIIDDVPDNISVLHRFLRQAGFRVLVAYDGTDGIETAEYALPDLILLDVMMPDLNGFEVCRQLKQQEKTRDIPIIFMTALTDIQDKVKGFAAGGVDYVTKPLQQEEVLARLTTHLNLKSAQQALQARNQALDAYAHSVSHDLKNPLSAVLTLTDSLLESLTQNTSITEQQLKELQFVRQAGQQAVNIIDALLLLAGVSRQKELTLAPLDMNQIIQAVLKERLALLQKRYQAIVHIPDHLPAAVGYRPWVEEIWVNYISNALKYGGSPPEISLGAEREANSMIRYWVKDNGPGLEATETKRLFTAFTRLDTAVKQVDGHGLGLSIVQQIAERLGGKVGVKSTPGAGSEFSFSLPDVR